MKAQGRFTVESGRDEPYEALDGGIRLTRADGKQTFRGDIKADGAVRWLMVYRADKTAEVVGVQRLSGTIGGRRGTVVLTTRGTHDGHGSAITLEIVRGSGSGELEGISGKGKLTIRGSRTGTYELDYTFGRGSRAAVTERPSSAGAARATTRGGRSARSRA